MFFCHYMLLDAPSHLYKRACPSVRPSVRPSPVIFKHVLGASCAMYPALFCVLFGIFGLFGRSTMDISMKKGTKSCTNTYCFRCTFLLIYTYARLFNFVGADDDRVYTSMNYLQPCLFFFPSTLP